MAVTQARFILGQVEIVNDLNANFDEIVRVIDNGN